MKTTVSLLLIAALSPAALLFSGCSKNETVGELAHDAKVATKDMVADAGKVASDSWDGIKDFTFDQRDDFAATLDRMGRACEADLAAMNAKLKDLPADSARTRDAAIKEFHDASAAFKVQLTALRASTAETWDATKAKTGAAWQRVQKAFASIPAAAQS